MTTIYRDNVAVTYFQYVCVCVCVSYNILKSFQFPVLGLEQLSRTDPSASRLSFQFIFGAPGGGKRMRRVSPLLASDISHPFTSGQGVPWRIPAPTETRGHRWGEVAFLVLE